MANAQNRDRRKQAAQASNKKRWRQDEINRNIDILGAPVKSMEVCELEEFQANKDKDDKRCTRAGPRRHPEKSQFAYWYHPKKLVTRRIPREAAFKPTKEIRR
jgi:hypothetical protein